MKTRSRRRMRGPWTLDCWSGECGDLESWRGSGDRRGSGRNVNKDTSTAVLRNCQEHKQETPKYEDPVKMK